MPDAIELPPLEIAEDFDFDAATKAFEEAEEKSRALAEELDLDLDDLVLVDDGENGPRLVPSAMAEEMIAKGGKMLVPQPGWEYPLASKPGRQLVPNHPGPREGHAEEDAPRRGRHDRGGGEGR